METEGLGIKVAETKKENLLRRSLYRMVWTSSDEYSNLLQQNGKEELVHGETVVFTRNPASDCRWESRYPPKRDFPGVRGRKSSESSVVLQTVYNPERFEIYRSAEGSLRYSQNSNTGLLAVVHTKRMDLWERIKKRNNLLRLVREKEQSG